MNIKFPVLLLTAALALLLPGRVALAQGSPDASALPVVISPADKDVQYLGRWDTRDAAGPRCEWSGSSVIMRASANQIDVVLSDTSDKQDWLEVVVDGSPQTPLELHQGHRVYPIFAAPAASNPPSPHTVELMKRTEAFCGTVQVLGFQLSSGGSLLAPPSLPTHKLEIIGDSITCGYGNEGKDEHEHFSPATENAYLSYGMVAGRALGADVHLIAWSGRKMSPDNTMPSIYNLTLPTDPTSAWDFRQWIPDAVIINLGTNDFNPTDPPRAPWTLAYEQFLQTVVRKNYPKAMIYLAIGPMMTDNWPPNQLALTTIKSYLHQIVADERQRGDTRIRTLFFTPQDPTKNGLGADYHPSLKTDAIMAAELEAAVRRDLNW